MGSNHSKCDASGSTSRRKPTTSSGFCGRARHTQGYKYFERVPEINGRAIGKLIVKLCGNEGCHQHLSAEEKTTLKFLRVANSFIPDVEDDGANLRNIAFILRQPGTERVIQSGNGDWEYDFCEDEDGEIYGRCIRKPLRRYIWDGVKQVVLRLGSAAMGFLTGTALKALPWKVL